MFAKSYSFSEKASRAVALFMLYCLATILPTACSDAKSAPSSPKPAAPVTAAPVLQKTVPVQLKAIGNVEAHSTVSVKSQVGGELTRVHFTEGQAVKRGDLLFTIDPRPFETALKQAEANLAKDTAQLENARREVRRYEELFKEGLIAQEQYDKIHTNANALESAVDADRAAVDNAHLLLKYCYIHTPITGVAGSLVVDQGNLVKANADTPMVVINQVQPIYVSFSVPEIYLPDIRRHMTSGGTQVEATETERGEGIEGSLTFVDNAVDSNTGTIRLKATFDNKENRLWPGQFVNVTVTLTTEQNALVVPSRAVQTGEKGQYVFVIKNDLTVDQRPVSVLRTINGEAVVEAGVQPGEQVVTDGHLRLTPGAKVDVKSTAEGSK